MADAISDADVVRLSGDCHVHEPTDLWKERLPAKFREVALEGQRYRPERARVGGWDPKAALRDAAADGISAQVLFPTAAIAIYQQFYSRPLDLDLCKAEERVYNDWLIEYCSENLDRLWGLGLIGLWDIDYAIAELQRTKEQGLKGATVWVAPPKDLPWESDHYERFWSAAVELDVPVCMHINVGFGDLENRASNNPLDTLARQSWGHKVQAMKAASELILSGVFDRHPELRVMLAEFECGWIPFFLEDLDRKSYGRPGIARDLNLKMLPSEYFSRNLSSTFLQDGVCGFLLERWGADNFIYSNDYPHGGGIWPYTDETIAVSLADLPSETKKKVLGENLAVDLLGVPLPAPVERLPLADYVDENWSRPWLKRPEGGFTFDKPKMGLAV